MGNPENENLPAANGSHAEQTNNTMRELTFGEKAVGLTFNPSGDTSVQAIKECCAEVIDIFNNLRNQTDNGEVKRMYSVAITEIQSAQMWGVKAATWKY